MKLRRPTIVQSYAGYRGEESPRVFRSGDIEYSVSRILHQTNERTIDGQWIRRFRVLTSAGEEFNLIQEAESAIWYLEIEV